MKKTSQAASPPRPAVTTHWFNYLFPLLPFLALTPNFFIIPSLTYQGLATQEVVFAAAVALCALIGLMQAWRAGSAGQLSRQTLWLFAPLLLLLCWQTLSLTWAPDRGEALRQLGFWCGFAVFSLAAWSSLRARTAWWLFYALLLLAAILALSLLLEYSTYGLNGMQGVFFNHGITAELLATLWPLFVCVFLFEKQDKFAIGVAALGTVFTTMALLLTLRRGALLGVLVASLLIFGGLISKQIKLAHRLRLVTVILAFLLFVLPLIIVKREAILTRLQGATELKTAGNTQADELGLTSRAVKWLTAWEMGKGNLVKGVGLGGYPARYADYRRHFVENPSYRTVAAVAETEDYDEIRSPLAHSEYLQLFAELGVIGILFYAFFWSQVLFRLWRLRQAQHGFLAFGALCCVVAFGVSSAISAFAFRLTPGIFILVSVLALGWAVREPSAEKEKASPAYILTRATVMGLWGFAVLVGLLLLVRNYNVYASQSTHGSQSLQTQLDFRFALNNDAANETLVRRYQRVLAYDANNAGAHMGLSILLFQMKRLPECLQHAEFAFQHGYNRPFTYLLLAFAHEHSGAPDKSQEILLAGLTAYPKSFILRAAYAELLRKRGQRETAQAQMAELEKRDEKFARSWALAMRYKDEEAAKLAKENGLIAPGDLTPELARVLTQARAYHYLRGTAPTP